MAKGKAYAHLRERRGDAELYTPVNEDLLALFERLRDEWGSWRKMGEAARVSQRWIRYVRQGRFKTMSMKVLDDMLSNLGAAGLVQQLDWYTPEELVERGIWKEQPTVKPAKKSEFTLAVEAHREQRRLREQEGGDDAA